MLTGNVPRRFFRAGMAIMITIRTVAMTNARLVGRVSFGSLFLLAVLSV